MTRDEVDNLVEWLRAQLDEDERLARRVADRYRIRNEDREDNGRPYWPLPSVVANLRDRGRDPDIAAGLDLIEAYGPKRVLDEVAAQRAILQLATDLLDEAFEWENHHATDARCIVKLLALPYADRPGCRDEWRP